MRRTIAALGACFLLSACGSSSAEPSDPVESTSTKAAEPTAGALGEPVTFEDHSSDGKITGYGELKVTSAEWAEGPQYVEKYDHTWTPEHQWLVVWVEWAGDFEFNSLNLRWIPDSTGDAVLPPLGMGAFPPGLGSSYTDSGNVVFDVQREPGSVMVVDIFGTVFGGWRIEA